MTNFTFYQYTTGECFDKEMTSLEKEEFLRKNPGTGAFIGISELKRLERCADLYFLQHKHR